MPSVSINNGFGSTFQRMGIELMSLLEKVQIYETKYNVIGIDLGKSNVLTAAYHDTSLQRVHMSKVKTDKEDRFKMLSNKAVTSDNSKVQL